jgi:hypothetical protein
VAKTPALAISGEASARLLPGSSVKFLARRRPCGVTETGGRIAQLSQGDSAWIVARIAIERKSLRERITRVRCKEEGDGPDKPTPPASGSEEARRARLATDAMGPLSVFWTRGTLNRLVNFMLRVPARMD